MIGTRIRSYGGYDLDFTKPAGEAAFVGPDSVSWQVFKNPVALFVGGITGVLLELAEPRVRSGVWDHTTFRTRPLERMERTGVAAMITVFGPRSAAERMITEITGRHRRVKGTTPGGTPYRATEPELLAWVQATAAFGFLEAFHTFVRPVSDADKDRYYNEGATASRLYGAVGAPRSRADLDALFERMAPKLERHAIVFEFLDIVRRAPILPWPVKGLQWMLIRAGVQITPLWARQILGLGAEYGLHGWELRLIGWLGRLSDRIPIRASPAVQACRRLGLAADFLYRR